MASVMKRMVAMIDMARTICPSWVRPAGVGADMRANPSSMLMMNQRRFHTMERSICELTSL